MADPTQKKFLPFGISTGVINPNNQELIKEVGGVAPQVIKDISDEEIAAKLRGGGAAPAQDPDLLTKLQELLDQFKGGSRVQTAPMAGPDKPYVSPVQGKPLRRGPDGRVIDPQADLVVDPAILMKP